MNLQGWILWLTLQSIQCSAFNFTSYYFANLTFILYEDVKFISDRLDQINVDTIFGLTLAKAHLSAALLSPNVNFLANDDRSILDRTMKLCNSTYVKAEDKINSKQLFNKQMTLLFQSDIWIYPINWNSKLVQPNLRSKIIFPEHEAASLIFKGTPRESESDYCLAQLARDDCKLPDVCAEILLRRDGSRGYPLTHRLLIIQAAKALQCKQSYISNYSTLIEKYCQQILQDLIDLESADFPSISRDLAMEQITLCGMEGNLNFVNKHYMDLVISWRNSFGCYSALKLNRRHRNKKSTKLMDHGCDSHASGVAAAVLSLFIRVYIENYLN